MTEESHYEIRAFDADGEQLSLSSDREASEVLRTDTVWEAVATLSMIPSNAWMHWNEGDFDRVPIARIKLLHFEVRRNPRGFTYNQQTLETIDRTG